jgi:hypothetical protein
LKEGNIIDINTSELSFLTFINFINLKKKNLLVRCSFKII